MTEEQKEKESSRLNKVLKILLFPFLIMVNPKIYFLDLEEDDEEVGGGSSGAEAPKDPQT